MPPGVLRVLGDLVEQTLRLLEVAQPCGRHARLGEGALRQHLQARFVAAELAEDRVRAGDGGARVEHLDEARQKEIYAELLPYGVRHEDAEMRNVTYRQGDGRFCLIDFEFATILDEEEKNGSPA